MEFYDYLQSHSGYFWQWEDEIEVISIPGGSTIAYRQYLFDVLDDMAEQGLPPFGSLLLAIIATNNTMDDSLAKVESILVNSLDKTEEDLIQKDAFAFLRKLEAVPQLYKEKEKRKLLLRTVFESCHGMLSAKTSAWMLGVVKKLSATNYKHSLLLHLSKKKDFSYRAYHRDFRCIALLNSKFPDAHSIVQKMANLAPVDKALPEIVPEKEQQPGKNFIEQLMEENKTHQVGALIKSIWAGLNIPFHSAFPSEQPLGGISDISNKGDYDRLLISEYANEDIVLMSRLANNEALFLQRETPPVSNKLERILLIDTSLKSWGTPKILAYSILLAIAKHPKTDMHCTAFAVGETFTPLKFDTVHDVIDCLQLLNENLTGAKGLEFFFKEMKDARQAEVILIASADSMRHPAMQHVISHNQKAFKYWITTEADGTIELFKNQRNGKRSLQKMQLPLEKLWEKKKSAQQPVHEEEEPLRNEYRLLFPAPQRVKKILCSLDSDVFIVTEDRCLFKYFWTGNKRNNKGVEFVLDKISGAFTNFAVGKIGNEDFLLGYNGHTKEIAVCNLQTKEWQYAGFPHKFSSLYNDFFFHDGAFVFMNFAHYWKITSKPEISITQFEIPGVALKQFYQKWNEANLEARKLYWTRYVVLKKIDAVSINEAGNLLLNNKHELVLFADGAIMFSVTSAEYRKATVKAQRGQAGVFYFPDGSKVRTTSYGMIILENAYDETNPHEIVYDPIHVPTALDSPLGLAAGLNYTGNDYYLPDSDILPGNIIDTGKFYNTSIKGFVNKVLSQSRYAN